MFLPCIATVTLYNFEFLEQSSNFGSMSPIRVPFTTPSNFKDGGIFVSAGKAPIVWPEIRLMCPGVEGPKLEP
jgi:hypothetical protein